MARSKASPFLGLNLIGTSWKISSHCWSSSASERPKRSMSPNAHSISCYTWFELNSLPEIVKISVASSFYYKLCLFAE